MENERREDGVAQQRRPKQEVYKPKRGANKPGQDRRMKGRTERFHDNLYKKMEGEEIPKTLRVSHFIWSNYF